MNSIKKIITKKEIEYHKRNTCRTDRKYLQGFKDGFDYAIKVIETKLKEGEINE